MISRMTLLKLFSLIIISGLILSIVDFDNYYDNVVPLSLFGVLITLLPFIFARNKVSPIVIFSVFLALAFFDFTLQSMTNSDIRYFANIPQGVESELRMQGLMLIILWTIVMYLAYFISPSSKSHLLITKPISARALKLIVIIFFIISLTAFLLAIKHIGGVSEIFSSMEDRSESYKGVGYLRFLVNLGVIAAIALIFLKRIKISILVMLIVFIEMASFGGRAAAFFGVVIPYVLIFHYFHKPIRIKSLVVIAVIGIGFVIAMDRFKYGDRDYLLSGEKAIGSVTRGMGDILPSTLYALDIGDLEYQRGATLLNIFYVVIPRSIWESKPEGLGEDALVGRALIGDDYWGLPPGPYGVAYINFHLIGLIIFAAFTGFLNKKMSTLFEKNMRLKKVDVYSLIYPLIFTTLFDVFSTYSLLSIITYSILGYIFIKLAVMMASLRLNKSIT